MYARQRAGLRIDRGARKSGRQTLRPPPVRSCLYMCNQSSSWGDHVARAPRVSTGAEPPRTEREQLAALSSLIRSGFRVRQDRVPRYVDYAANLHKIARPQHQVVFGRRGSGKSSLLLTYHATAISAGGHHSIYINADVLKRASYPDAVAWVLLTIFRELPIANRKRNKLLGLLIAQLESILEREDLQDVVDQHSSESAAGASVGAPAGVAHLSLSAKESASHVRTTTSKSDKLDLLERRLPDYAAELARAMSESDVVSASLVIDDLYLLERDIQPDFVDYLHRLTRGTPLYLKIGTVRHRTKLQRVTSTFIGVEVGQDVEQIDLDTTLEQFPVAVGVLRQIVDNLAVDCGLADFSETYLANGILELVVLASGGVVRDSLHVLADIVDERAVVDAGPIRAAEVFSSLADFWYRNKLPALNEEVSRADGAAVETLLTDLRRFCIQETKSPVFAIRRSDLLAQKSVSETVADLADLKFIHLLQRRAYLSDGATEAAIYILDLSAFGLFQDDESSGPSALNYRDPTSPIVTTVPIANAYSLTRGEMVLSARHPIDDDLLPIPGTPRDAVVGESPGVPTPPVAAQERETEVDPPARPRSLPKSRPAQSTEFAVGGAEGIFTVSSYPDGRGPGELHIRLGKQGSTLAGVLDGFGIVTSIALQHGVPLVTLVQRFTNMRFEPAGLTDDPDIRMAQSVLDYIFRRIALDYLPVEERLNLGIMTAEERQRQLDAQDRT